VTGAFLTALFFAGNAVCARRAALHYGGTEGNFLRLLLATALLGAWAHAAGQGVGGGAFAWFFVSGAVGFGLGGLTMFHALPLIGSNLSMLIVQCGMAVAGALLEWLWLGARLSAVQAALAALTLIGVAIGLVGPIGLVSPRRQALPRFTWGVLLAAISACAQGGAAVISRKAFAVLHTNG
jgi:drug/metabolite transporter (DMT)-like permease